MRHARRDAGFTLAGLICFLTAATVMTAVMVPLRSMESKREQEKELIFRGEEYVRAIQKYQRKYGPAYPAAIDDLLSRDGYRFLRKQYKDPITGEDFRLINVNQDGTLTGSVTMLSLPVSNQARPGGGITPGSIGGTPGSLPTGGNTGQNPNGQNNSANTNSVGNVGGMGGSIAPGGNPFGGGQNNANGRPAGVGNPTGSGVGTGAGAFGGGTFGTGGMGIGGSPLGVGTGTNGQNTGNNTGRPGNTGTPGGLGGVGGVGGIGGTGGPGATSAIGNNALTGANGGGTPQITPGIAGIGSQASGTAVMVYNTKEKYNEWEFIAPLEQQAQQSGANTPNGQSGPNNQNGRPNTGQNPNQGPGNPLNGGGTTPFGGGTSPFGTGGGTTGFGGNPLGTGGANQPAPPAGGRR